MITMMKGHVGNNCIAVVDIPPEPLCQNKEGICEKMAEWKGQKETFVFQIL